jgi:hypothetical protein
LVRRLPRSGVAPPPTGTTTMLPKVNGHLSGLANEINGELSAISALFSQTGVR